VNEAERPRERGAEAPPQDAYEASIRAMEKFAERQRSGEILVSGEERKWEDTRQGRIKYYLSPRVFTNTALQDWKVFIQDIKNHSGRHTHQGGLVIYVWQGRGHTMIDGERHDWEEGDMIILPIKPGGVDHQHFNADETAGCVWIAFINTTWQEAVASHIRQGSVSPSFRGEA